MTTIQEHLRLNKPHFFENDEAEDPEVLAIRDRLEWNDPFYRQLMVVKYANDLLTRKEEYWVPLYCEEEFLPYRWAIEGFEEKLFEGVPKPFSLRMIMAVRKIHDFLFKDDFLFKLYKSFTEVKTFAVAVGLLVVTATFFPSSTLLGGITCFGGLGGYIYLRYKQEERAYTLRR